MALMFDTDVAGNRKYRSWELKSGNTHLQIQRLYAFGSGPIWVRVHLGPGPFGPVSIRVPAHGTGPIWVRAHLVRAHLDPGPFEAGPIWVRAHVGPGPAPGPSFFGPGQFFEPSA